MAMGSPGRYSSPLPPVGGSGMSASPGRYNSPLPNVSSSPGRYNSPLPPVSGSPGRYTSALRPRVDSLRSVNASGEAGGAYPASPIYGQHPHRTVVDRFVLPRSGASSLSSTITTGAGRGCGAAPRVGAGRPRLRLRWRVSARGTASGRRGVPIGGGGGGTPSSLAGGYGPGPGPGAGSSLPESGSLSGASAGAVASGSGAGAGVGIPVTRKRYSSSFPHRYAGSVGSGGSGESGSVGVAGSGPPPGSVPRERTASMQSRGGSHSRGGSRSGSFLKSPVDADTDAQHDDISTFVKDIDAARPLLGRYRQQQDEPPVAVAAGVGDRARRRCLGGWSLGSRATCPSFDLRPSTPSRRLFFGFVSFISRSVYTNHHNHHPTCSPIYHHHVYFYAWLSSRTFYVSVHAFTLYISYLTSTYTVP
ncbi:hypothetical protein B0H14DRAFT_1158303 [Mycena olivaceomarginata]|nr:hypothetical protein B0H14DRAFT_1158303 [Mycena olivaceomarginata]